MIWIEIFVIYIGYWHSITRQYKSLKPLGAQPFLLLSGLCDLQIKVCAVLFKRCKRKDLLWVFDRGDI